MKGRRGKGHGRQSFQARATSLAPPTPHIRKEEPMAPPHDHDHDHDHDHGHGHGHQHAHGGPLGEHAELVFALLAGVFVLGGWLLETWQASPGWLALACYALAYLAGGWFTVGEALANLRARRFEIDTLMLVAAAGAAALGQWAEGGLLLFLFSLGHSLEHFAMGRARRAIEALAQFAPERATLREGEHTREVEVSSLRAGDQLLVKPNERFPADGFVLAGQSSVNQAPITGESLPVEKVPVSSPRLRCAISLACPPGTVCLPAASMDGVRWRWWWRGWPANPPWPAWFDWSS